MQLRPTLLLSHVRLKLLARNRSAIFFAIIFPIIFLFIYGFLFARGDPEDVRFLMGPVVVLTILGSGFWGVGFQIVFWRERNVLRRFRPAPVGARPLLLSGVLANWVLQVFVVGLEFLLARLFFHISWPAEPASLFILGSLGLFAFASLGMVVASITNTMQETQVICNLLMFALMFLSGATVPFAQLPEVIRHVALFLPSFYLVYATQASIFGAARLRSMVPELAALVITTLVCYLLSLKLFRWDQQMRLSWRDKAWAVPAVVPFFLLGIWANLYSDRINQALALYRSVIRR
ncbi:MAG: ABC transporter permease [Acidobacteria bacterium]|nr:ABC transporter permease [Acidobacteriota bacterium]